MAEYDFHVLDGRGSVVGICHAVCPDDENARALATRVAAPDRQAEVWSGTRFLGRVSPFSSGRFVLPSRPQRAAPLGRKLRT